jgi:hypothetical protein
MKGNGQEGITEVAELHARRWKEDRPYFMLHGINRGVGLPSWWLRRRACGGLDLHWSRMSAAQLRAQRNAASLSKMRRGSFLINTSRRPLVVEQDGCMRDDDRYGADLLHDYPRRFPRTQQPGGSP